MAGRAKRPAEASVVPLRSRSAGGGLADARRYTPRGRTVREGQSRDPFRPALELIGTRPPVPPEDPEESPGSGGRTKSPGSGGRTKSPGSGGRTKSPGSGGRTKSPGSGGQRPVPTGRGQGTPTGKVRAPGKAPAPGRAPASGRGGAAGTVAPERMAPGRRAGRGRRGGETPPALLGTGRSGTTPRKARPTPRRPIRKPRRIPRLAEPLRRLRLGTVIMLVLFLVIAGRLVTLQLTDARAYARQGLGDRLTQQVLFAPRGAIYDRDHNVLAQSVQARYVFADPSKIKAADVLPTANALRDLLGIKTSELVPKLSRKVRADGSKDMFEYLARGVDIATGDAVVARNLPGIGVGRDEVRTEPGNDLAANLIGFTGYDGSGRSGLEAGYEKLLAGQNGSHTFEVANSDGDLVQIPGGYDEEKPARPGSSLELTINRDLQYQVQHVLAQQMAKANATLAAAVVLDAHTGEVYAQASYPTYDAANPGDSTTAQRMDAATQAVVEPGSVHKVITLGAALQTGVINASSTVPVCPSIRVADQSYPDTHPQRCGTRMTLPGIFAYSSDVATITVAKHMTPRTLYDFQRRFGLGAATGEGVPGEAPGLVQPPANWSGTSPGSIPIGLGVSVTPLQMAAVYATIANDGVYVAPRLIKATISPDGTAHPAAAAPSRRVLSSENAATLRQDLEAVVTVKGATGLAAAVPGYRVAGKTGTGLYVKNGKYAPGEVASFVGMAPADAPRFVIAVVAYTPGGSGGKIAAPAFQQMMQFALRLYHVPPTGTRPPTFAITR